MTEDYEMLRACWLSGQIPDDHMQEIMLRYTDPVLDDRAGVRHGGGMSKIDDGGPAFPTEQSVFLQGMQGMSLRKWFAGQALAGLVGHSEHRLMSAHALAQRAYQLADAMIAEGNKDGAE